jgi:hypothetical protein
MIFISFQIPDLKSKLTKTRRHEDTKALMQAPKVNYRDFDPNDIVKTPPQQKQSQPKPDPNNPNAPPAPITYFEIPLSYKYKITEDGNTKSVISDLYIEGPELFTPGGINTKEMNGKQVHSIFTQFNLQDPETVAFIGNDLSSPGTMERLYRAVIDRLDEVKGSVGLGRLQHKMMIEGVTTYPIHWPRDATTGQVIVGKNPSKYFSLFSYGQGYSQRRTLFCAPIFENGKPTILDWDMLRSVEMKYKPLFHFKKIYIGGGKASIQFEITSAVVTHIVKANTESNQTDTMEVMQRNDALTQSLRAQIAALNLAMDKKDGVSNEKSETVQGMVRITDHYPREPQVQATPSRPTEPQLRIMDANRESASPGHLQFSSQVPGISTTLSSMLNNGPMMTSFPSHQLPPPSVHTLH